MPEGRNKFGIGNGGDGMDDRDPGNPDVDDAPSIFDYAEPGLRRVEDEPNSEANLRKRKQQRPGIPPFAYTPTNHPLPEKEIPTSIEDVQEDDEWVIINGVRHRIYHD